MTYQYLADGSLVLTSTTGSGRTATGSYTWVDENHIRTVSVLNHGKPQIVTIVDISDDKMTQEIFPMTGNFTRVQAQDETPRDD